MDIKPKEKYRHFKGDIVEIIGKAKNTETLEEMVVYTHNNEMWVRPLTMFFDQENIMDRKDNVTHQKHRFEKIEEE